METMTVTIPITPERLRAMARQLEAWAGHVPAAASDTTATTEASQFPLANKAHDQIAVDIPPPPPAKPKVDAKGVVFNEALHSGSLNNDGTWRKRRNSKAKKPPIDTVKRLNQLCDHINKLESAGHSDATKAALSAALGKPNAIDHLFLGAASAQEIERAHTSVAAVALENGIKLA